MEKREILPGAVYDAPEVAELLGLQRVKTIYEIPETELAASWVGPRRGKKVYRGADVIAYLDRTRSPGAPKLKAG
jgi:hypothetical protein